MKKLRAYFNLTIVLSVVLSLFSCNREPRMYKGGVEYICFASKTQTVEVTPTTTVANIDIQVEWNDDQNIFKEKKLQNFGVKILSEGTTAIAGVHYVIQDNMLSGTGLDHFDVKLLPENISEELTLTLRLLVSGQLDNPDKSKYTGYDTIKLTFKPNK